MSSPFSSQHLAGIREGARRAVEGARAHEGHRNALVEPAVAVADQASALAVALVGGESNPNELPRLCSAHPQRTADDADAARRARVSAREQPVP